MSTDDSHGIVWMCFFVKGKLWEQFLRDSFFRNGPIEFRKVVNVMHVESFELL